MGEFARIYDIRKRGYLFSSSPSPPPRTISSTKYVDDGSKYGIEEIKYVTSTCGLDVDPSKGQQYGNPMSSAAANGQAQMGQNGVGGGGGGAGPGSGGGANVIMVGSCSGEEDNSMSQQQHQVKTEDTHTYVLPFLH